ncbi:MAG: phosphoribosyl-AMP cyclohydrolase [Rhizobiaceae bacterium]
MSPQFPSAKDKEALESGDAFTPRFDADGLVTAVVTDAADGELLMVAHMNAEALAMTLETRQAWFWSRSRQELWHKGATSGETQKVHEIRVDCDQDAVWLKVEVEGRGAACHTGRKSCFYRRIDTVDGKSVLASDTAPALFDPQEVYRK